MQWNFMAGAARPVNSKAHPLQINLITGNINFIKEQDGRSTEAHDEPYVNSRVSTP
jgi:hypothetical protein